MKTTLLLSIILFAICGLLLNASAQNVAITDDDSYNADPSAMLDIKSLSKGMLIPRLTSVQRIAIASPATGLMVYQTDNTPGFYYYTGSVWTMLDGSVTNELQALSISNDTLYLTNGGFVKLPAGFSGDYNALTNKPAIPANVSELTNDAGYLTTFTEVDASVTNELQALSRSNDTIYLTNGGFVKLPAGFDGQYSSLTGKPTLATVATTGSYNDLSSKPTIPTTTSELTNNSGFLTSEVDASVTNELQVLSISNDTIYLTNGGFAKLPAGFDGQYSSLTGKPTLATVATTGSYNDLSSKPTIPTTTSELTNNSGFLTSEVDASVTNELQALSISNDTIYLTNGGFVKLPASTDSIWSKAGSIVSLQNNLWSMGVGTNSPAAKLEVKGDASIGIDEPLLAVVNNNGDTVFAVYQSGVRITVEDSPAKATGSKGGFAVGGFSPAKGSFTNEYLRVTPDSIRMYIEEGNALKATGSKGGFAVGGFSPAKTTVTNEYLRVTDDSVRVYIEENNPAKATASKGGFAVGGFSPAKSATINDYLSVNSDSINVSKSMYLPRMSTTERDNIGFTPSEALIIYNTSDDCMQIFKNGVWSNIWCFQCAPIVIIQPFNATICNGEDTSFAVSATGTNLAYQWQKSTDGGVTWNNLTNGGSNPTYSGVASVLLSLYNVPVANHGYLYRCYITASCLPATYSDVVTLNVGGPSITITSQPQDFQTLANCNASFGISTDAFGNFQWQVSTDGGTIWNNITDGGTAPVYSGVTTDSLSLLNVPLSFANYKYRCVVSSSCGAGTNSNAAFLTINTTTPLATAATNVSYFSFTANWNPVTDATGYFMDISTDINFSSFIPGYNNLFVGNVTTYNVLCLIGGTTYYYRLRAQLLCGTDNSNKITVSTLNNAALAATNVSYFSFDANWNTVAGATAYYLDASTASDFSSFVSGYNNLNVGDITTYSVTCLSGNKTYYYRIRAQSTCVSGNSNVVTLSTLNAAIAATAIFSSKFTANWYAVPGATSYYLDVSTVADFSSYVAGYNNFNVGNVVTYNITGLNVVVTYYYRIRAVIFCGVSGNSNIISLTTQFVIGESYGGGKIAYIDGTGLHGLIAATSDQSTGAWWGCQGTTISGADGTAIGTGNQNTIDIEAGCTTAGIAADIAANLVLNGFSDWFLPSKDELNQLYINRVAIGGFTSNWYWSSSEVNANDAWRQYFSTGTQFSNGKDFSYYVRCVRSF